MVVLALNGAISARIDPAIPRGCKGAVLDMLTP